MFHCITSATPFDFQPNGLLIVLQGSEMDSWEVQRGTGWVQSSVLTSHTILEIALPQLEGTTYRERRRNMSPDKRIFQESAESDTLLLAHSLHLSAGGHSFLIPLSSFNPWQVVGTLLTINRFQGVFQTSNSDLASSYSQDVSTSWSQTLPQQERQSTQHLSK